MSKITTKNIPTVKLKSLHNPDSYKLVEDTPIEGNPELELVEFLKEGEASVEGDEMFERACKLGNRAGQQHAERLILQEDTIPKEWRSHYIVFTGTRRSDGGGHMYFPCLYWHEKRWRLNWSLVQYPWNLRVRLVRCK